VGQEWSACPILDELTKEVVNLFCEVYSGPVPTGRCCSYKEEQFLRFTHCVIDVCMHAVQGLSEQLQSLVAYRACNFLLFQKGTSVEFPIIQDRSTFLDS
jgi:hypothetical protein